MNIHNFQIELVRGCTRRCEFCGINNIMDARPPKKMTVELATEIAKQISADFKSKVRIEFAVHGEPLLNPNVVEIVRQFRSILKQAQLSIISNGDIIYRRPEIVRELFLNGLNILMVDFYGDNPRINQNIMDTLRESNVALHNFYDDEISPWGYHPPKTQAIIVTPNIGDETGKRQTRIIHTAGGNLPKPMWVKYKIDPHQFPYLKRCAKPFREMTINWDGNVSLCCEDWTRRMSLGNIADERLIDIWNGETMNRYRYLLYHGRRDLIPLCAMCNERSFRVGLLKVEREYPEIITPIKNDQNNLLYD